jgi:disulfide oxidoreductase YuzD
MLVIRDFDSKFLTSLKLHVMSKFWLKDPQKHDFPAAADYLNLLFNEKDVKVLVEKLEAAKTIFKKAKDILRASELPLLNRENIHVRENLQMIKKGDKMSPVLLVKHNAKLIVADGYHRLCAIYYLSEDEDIPCRLVQSDLKNKT